ncbi:ribonuclease III [bacterium]|nr:ribonuclease III [bacterium]|tara:strand:+ start:9502 stop:10194 length:693 start_codon:yes stop_codon:yes gene_type:complete
MKDFAQFEKQIGFSFKDKQLLQTAFTHRSYLNENRGFLKEHNERLEFLGDAVLELAVTDFLYHKYPERPEGELTAFRASLVNTQSISAAATQLGMNDYLLLSRGEAKDTGRARQYILANTFEAFIGALYMDQGYEAANRFIEKSLFGKIDEIVEKRLWQDAKSYFQEKAQEEYSATPSYELVQEAGPDHDKKFISAAKIKGEAVAQGEGRSKQEAEQEAARKALEVKGWV